MCDYLNLCRSERDFSLSDRLAVMYKGNFSGLFQQVDQVTEEELGQYMLGLKNDLKKGVE